MKKQVYQANIGLKLMNYKRQNKKSMLHVLELEKLYGHLENIYRNLQMVGLVIDHVVR